MLTEFGGKPVAGGTLPALIWKSFMTRADEQLELEPEQFAATPYIPAQEKRIVWRRGSYKLDNGFCPGTRVVAYFAGRGPAARAECYANEVTVPLVIGKALSAANETLAQQPLESELIGVPAKAGTRPGFVVKQEPRNGFLSANDPVRLFVTRPDPRYGLLPNLVGSSATAARARLRTLKARTKIRYAKGPAGSVLEQTPQPGVAAGRGLKVTLVVGRCEAHLVPLTRYRHGNSAALVMPTRGVATTSMPAMGGSRAKGGPPSGMPSSSPLIPSAWVNLPGPEHRARSAEVPRRMRISSSP